MDLAKYRKFIAAALGFLALFMKEILGLDLDNVTADKIVDGIIAILSVGSVFFIRNKSTVAEARESQKSVL